MIHTASTILSTITASGRTITPERAENLARFIDGWTSFEVAVQALMWADHLDPRFNRSQIEDDMRTYRVAMDQRHDVAA